MKYFPATDVKRHVVELSRRNLTTLLEKLDDPLSHKRLIDPTQQIDVVAVEDEEHYRNRAAGPVEMPSKELRAKGCAVVKLPDPESTSPWSWLGGAVTATKGSRRVRLYQEDHRYTSENAREIAAALLAAADIAEST